ncbi:MAG: M28 family peptidase [Candidatus Bathyarchaeia archaeon]
MGTIRFRTVLNMTLLLLATASSLPLKILCNSVQNSWGGLASIEMDNVMRHVEFFSSVESRMTGYLGFYKASEYITEEFNKTLGNVVIEEFEVTAPIQHFAEIYIESPERRVLKAYTFWPNLAESCSTSEDGLRGPLYYVGYGTLSEMNGKPIDGSIVLMELNNRWFWRIALNMGAKAAIFIEPEDSFRGDYWAKTLQIPINFPRLYITREDGEYLKKLVENYGNLTVTVKSYTTWEKVKAYNILAEVKGTDPELSKEYIVLAAYYDSLSIVPALAPGASESLGISLLLELGRVFKENPPKRSILFVALGGHGLGLAGAREFVWKHFQEIGEKYKLFISLDLSTESSDLAVQFYGGFYALQGSVPGYETKFQWLRDKIFNEYLKLYRAYGGSIRLFDSLALTNIYYEPTPLYVDSEPFVLAGGIGFTFKTFNVFRRHLFTPLDRLEDVEIDRLKPQAEFIALTLRMLCEEARLAVHSKPTVIGVGYGFVTLSGYVQEYNLTKGWYQKVSNALVQLPFWPTLIVEKTDENGYFQVKGLRAGAYYWFNGFIVDQYGHVIGTNEYGGFAPPLPNLFGITLYRPDAFVNIKVFRCGSIHISYVVDPRTFYTPYGSYTVLNNFKTHVTLITYGPVYTDGYDFQIFIPPDTPVEVFLRTGGTQENYAILLNITESNKDGTGYVVKPGETLRIRNLVLEAPRSFYILNEERLKTLHSFNAFSIRPEEYHRQAQVLLQEAYDAFKSMRYSEGYYKAIHAWCLEAHAYSAIKDFIIDLAYNSSLTYIFTLPLIIMVTMGLLKGKSGGLKILTFQLILSLFFMMLLYLYSPGFNVATNIYVMLGSLFIVTLIVLVLIVLWREFLTTLNFIRRKFMRIPHEESDARLGVKELAFRIKRFLEEDKARFLTIIIISSLATCTFLLTSFCSSCTYVFESPVSFKAEECRILLRKWPWDAFAERHVDLLRIEFADNALISCRVWMYPSYQELRIDGNCTVKGFLGLSYEEFLVTQINGTIEQGGWFERNDLFACIVSDEIAKALNVKPGDRIEIWGIPLKLRGIFNSSKMDSLRDLDGEPITPKDLFAPYGEERAVHLPASSVVIVPYELAMKMGGTIYSVTIKPYDLDLIHHIARSLAYRSLGVYVYASSSEYVKLYWSRMGYRIIFLDESLTVFLSLSFIVVGFYTSYRVRSRYVDVRARTILIKAVLLGLTAYPVGLFFGQLLSIFFYRIGILPGDVKPNFSTFSLLVALLPAIATSLSFYGSSFLSFVEKALLETLRMREVLRHGREYRLSKKVLSGLEERSVLGIMAFIGEQFKLYMEERYEGFQTLDIGFFSVENLKRLKLVVQMAPWEFGIISNTTLEAIKGENELYDLVISVRCRGGLEDRHLGGIFNKILTMLNQWSRLDKSSQKYYIENALTILGEHVMRRDLHERL